MLNFLNNEKYLAKNIINEINLSFNLFTKNGFSNFYNIYLPKNNYNFFKYIFGLIYLLYRPKCTEKYIFLEFRNYLYATKLEINNVLFISSFSSNFKKKKIFLYTGLITAISYSIRYNITLPLCIYIRLYKKIFNTNEKYFFLHEDTLPIGIFLTSFAKYYNHKSICIEHGHPLSNFDIIDGRRSSINLLMTNARKKLLPQNSIIIEIGLPYEIVTNKILSKPSEVIFIGTGWVQNVDLYKKSLQIFKSLLNLIITKSDYRIFYRPHPMENKFKNLYDIFDVNQVEKIQLLSTSPKLFIGFSSTLLFEASYFGHPIIELVDIDLINNRLIGITPNNIYDLKCDTNFNDVVNNLMNNNYNLLNNNKLDNFLNKIKDI